MINGVTYDFRNEEFPNRQFPTTRQLGFIAQNLENVVPEVVMTDGNGYKAVDYAKLTALLNEAIKEQQDIIENQENQISQLKAEMRRSNERSDRLAQEISSIKDLIKSFQTSELSE